ncbi:MAG: nuclear transport factor 2 family protein [Mucilaginibacter sp.]
MSQDIKAIANQFIRTLEHRKSADELMQFYHPDIKHIEFPNMITKNRKVSTLNDIKAAAERGKKVLQKEEYEVLNSWSFENTVIIEAIWTGTLAVPMVNIPVGGQMKAYFAQFYEFKDGKIFKQRNYDCFEPF